MTNRHIHQRLFLLKNIVAVMLLCNFDSVAAEMIPLPGDFRLGSSLEDVKQHAASRGWQLVRLSPELPGWWLVKDRDISLYACGDAITSVGQSYSGTLDDFARLVTDLGKERGEPQLKVGSFMAGSTRISTIDARFSKAMGIDVAVQFSSTGGKLVISTNFSEECTGRLVDR